MACNLFNRDIVFDCVTPQQGGIDNRIIILNRGDWMNSTVTVDGSTNEIDSITLAAGGVEGYELKVNKASQIIATWALRPNTNYDGYDHSVDCTVNTIEQLDAEVIAKVRFTKIVVIVPLLEGRAYLLGGTVDSTPEPQGVGMRLSEDGGNLGDAALGGAMKFIAKTPDDDPAEIAKPHLIASSVNLDTLLTPTA